MAKQTVLVSDLSGEQIAPGQEATVAITYSDARKGRITLDVSASEVEEMASKGKAGKRRGRKAAEAATEPAPA